MKVINERIIEATEKELFSYWLTSDYCEFYSFYDFLEKMKDAGCKVVKEKSALKKLKKTKEKSK